MLISRKNLEPAINTINKLSDKTFNINTQYKLIKIKKQLVEELEIYYEQLENLKQYCQKDENGNYITSNDGAFMFKEGKKSDCLQALKNLNSLEVQVTDCYLSLDELEEFNLTLSELETLEPFIKD